MVGAAVLVLVFVVVAPMLLDGREEAGSAAKGKGESSAGSNRTEVIVLNSPSQSQREPAPKVDVSRPKPVASPPPKVAKPRPKSVARAAPRTARKPAVNKVNNKGAQAPREGFAIQLGSFLSRDNAVGFAASIREGGYPVFVVQGVATAGAVYRVYVGPKDSRREAEGLAARLAADGQSVLVVDLAGSAGG
jgi:DedD protein